MGLTVKYIILTHGHFDHILALPEIKEKYKAPILIHKEDEKWFQPEMMAKFIKPPKSYIPQKANEYLYDGMKINIGRLECTVMHTPGHTMGSCILICKDIILAGDTVFLENCGRCDFPESDPNAMVESLRKIAALPGDYRIFCGHGPATTLSHEREYNTAMKMSVRT